MCVPKRLLERNHTRTIIYGIPEVYLPISHFYQQTKYVNDIILESPHKCSICGKTYTRKIILEKHMKSHYPQEKVPETVKTKFPCDFCPKVYTRKEYLKAHISIHTQGVQFISTGMNTKN